MGVGVLKKRPAEGGEAEASSARNTEVRSQCVIFRAKTQSVSKKRRTGTGNTELGIGTRKKKEGKKRSSMSDGGNFGCTLKRGGKEKTDKK